MGKQTKEFSPAAAGPVRVVVANCLVADAGEHPLVQREVEGVDFLGRLDETVGQCC